MSYTEADLTGKLQEMYPEIAKYGLSLSLKFDDSAEAWVVTFEKQGHQRHAFLDKADADACMEGNVCIYLGMLITQYIKDMEALITGG